MNRLKGLELRFSVKNNPKLSEAIQLRVFELGGKRVADNDSKSVWNNNVELLCVRDGILLVYISDVGQNISYTESTLDDLYHLPKAHTITIDGNDIELSEGSYQALKEQFK